MIMQSSVFNLRYLSHFCMDLYATETNKNAGKTFTMIEIWYLSLKLIRLAYGYACVYMQENLSV